MNRMRLTPWALLAALLSPAVARAEEPNFTGREAPNAAAAAYDRGAAAYDAHDYPLALRELARADELEPNDVALALALRAAVKANDAVTGMTLVERGEARTMDASLDEAAHIARRELASRVGKLAVDCTSCTVTLDGAPFPAGQAAFASVGVHAVSVVRPQQPDASGRVRVVAASTVVWHAPAAFVQTAPTPPRPRPLWRSPVWFYVGAGLTGALAAGTLASGLDTTSKRDAFEGDRSSEAAARSGRNAEARTNALLAGTLVAATATTVLGLAIVQWSRTRAGAVLGFGHVTVRAVF